MPKPLMTFWFQTPQVDVMQALKAMSAYVDAGRRPALAHGSYCVDAMPQHWMTMQSHWSSWSRSPVRRKSTATR